jgi:hypothetical protein
MNVIRLSQNFQCQDIPAKKSVVLVTSFVSEYSIKITAWVNFYRGNFRGAKWRCWGNMEHRIFPGEWHKPYHCYLIQNKEDKTIRVEITRE